MHKIAQAKGVSTRGRSDLSECLRSLALGDEIPAHLKEYGDEISSVLNELKRDINLKIPGEKLRSACISFLKFIQHYYGDTFDLTQLEREAREMGSIEAIHGNSEKAAKSTLDETKLDGSFPAVGLKTGNDSTEVEVIALKHPIAELQEVRDVVAGEPTLVPDAELSSDLGPAGGQKVSTYTAAELRAGGCSAAVLRNGGYSAAELRTVRYSSAEMKGVGYTAAELKAGGYCLCCRAED